MRFLVLDFETKDPYLSKAIDLGPGWVYKLHVPTALSFAVGFSYCFIEDNKISEAKYISLIEHKNEDLLKDLVKNNRNIVMHNAQYDLGYLLTFNININNLKIYDTKIIGRLYDNTLM